MSVSANSAASGAEPDPVQLAALAEDVAREAGELALSLRRRGIELAGTKSSRSDVVTAADLAVERLVRDRLAAARPGDAVLGEEGGEQPGGQQTEGAADGGGGGTGGAADGGGGGGGGAAVTWVVDPIDGTVNYVYGIPAWAVSVAASVGGTVVAGAVVNPGTGEVFTASLGGGARLGGQPLVLSGEAPELAVSLVATGFGYRPANRAADGWVVAQLLPDVRDIRRIGCASLDLCWVATGAQDAYWERGLNPWDHAAGGLVAAEAGARVEGLASARAGSDLLIAAPPALFGPLHDRLAPLLSDPRGRRPPG